MAELKDRLRADLNTAMRARDQVRMRTLRMALTSITTEEVAGTSARELSDASVEVALVAFAKHDLPTRLAADLGDAVAHQARTEHAHLRQVHPLLRPFRRCLDD